MYGPRVLQVNHGLLAIGRGWRCEVVYMVNSWMNEWVDGCRVV